MYVFVITVGFLTASFGLVCMLANTGFGDRTPPALWAIVAALGVLQICFGAVGRTLASLVQQMSPPPIPEADEPSEAEEPLKADGLLEADEPLKAEEPLAADGDLFDKPDDERRI